MNIITYGTFDILHKGHINLLLKAKQYSGDYLIVAVSTDEFNQLKGKMAYESFEIRKAKLEALPFVDKVIAEKSWEQKFKDIEEYDVDIFVIGDDWKGKFDYLERFCDVVYLPRTPGISSSDLRKKMEAGL